MSDAISDLPPLKAGGGVDEMDYPNVKVLTAYQRWARQESHKLCNHVARFHSERDRRLFRMLEPGQTMIDLPVRLRPCRWDISADMFYGTRKEFSQPVRCGVIAAITKEAYNAREKYWSSIGFVGRCIPVSFSYSEKTKLKIHEHIRKGFPAKIIQIITGRATAVEIPTRIAEKVQDLAIARTPFSTGFRLHKQLRSLIQAHALYCGRSKVKMEDFEEVRRLSKFMNLGFHQI